MNKLKKILLPIVIIIVIIFIAVAFVGSSPDSSNEGPSIADEDSTNSDSQNESTQREFAVGDKIDFEGRILTVNSIQRSYIEDSQYAMEPEEGKEFVLVNVSIENNSDSPISFNVFDFKIENSSGVRTSTAYVGKVPNELNSGELAVGGKVDGNMPFEVTEGETGLKLIFNPSFWSDREVEVKLD